LGIGLERLEALKATIEEDTAVSLVEKLLGTEQNLLRKIDTLDKELDKYNSTRLVINTLKISKDNLVKNYIETTSFNKVLDIKYLNYKALLFYFLENFTYQNMILEFTDYHNNLTKIYALNREVFSKLFIDDMPIKINVQLVNFPHLIGYKDKYFDTTSNEWIQQQSTKKAFLKNILYESNLTNDYTTDGCDINKIEAFAWIISTLKKPTYIFDKNGLKEHSELKTDLIFVRRKEKQFHYVSLKKHLNNKENEYYINSHHHLTAKEYNNKFIQNNLIYHFDFDKISK